MESLWTPLFAIMVFTFVIGVLGGWISSKTKALVSAVIVSCLLYFAGYLTGIIPKDSLDSTGIPAMMSSFGITLTITNLGTMINLKDFIKEWKTVVISFVGLIGIAAIAFTVGSWIFGREYALCAASPISGGLIATILTSAAANEAGRPELAAFATLICAFQIFFGLPVASKCLKSEANRLIKNNFGLDEESVSQENKKKELNLKVIKKWPKWTQTTEFTVFKVAFVAVLSSWVSNLTILPGHSSPILNSTILCLIFGVLFTEFGFLEKNSLQNANVFGMMMLGLMTILPGNFKDVDGPQLLSMIVPIVGMLALGVIGIAIFSVIAGKLMHYSVPMSIAIGVTALFGYPCTQFVTDEVVATLDIDENQKAKIHNFLLPKMLIGGFTTVTVASVLFAGVIVPLIF